MNLFKSIINFFIGDTAVKSAKLAGLFVALNNPGKARVILPLLKIARTEAKQGSMTELAWEKLMTSLMLQVKDSKFNLFISEFINVPDFTGKDANAKAAELLDAFILGMEEGV